MTRNSPPECWRSFNYLKFQRTLEFEIIKKGNMPCFPRFRLRMELIQFQIKLYSQVSNRKQTDQIRFRKLFPVMRCKLCRGQCSPLAGGLQDNPCQHYGRVWECG